MAIRSKTWHNMNCIFLLNISIDTSECVCVYDFRRTIAPMDWICRVCVYKLRLVSHLLPPLEAWRTWCGCTPAAFVTFSMQHFLFTVFSPFFFLSLFANHRWDVSESVCEVCVCVLAGVCGEATTIEARPNCQICIWYWSTNKTTTK